MAETSLIFRLLAKNDTAAGLKSARGAFEGFKSVLGGILGAEAIGGVGEFLKSSVDAAEKAQIAFNLTAAAVKSTGAAAGVSATDVKELSDKIALVAGVMPDVVQSAANMVLRFTNIRNVGVDKVFDETTQAATDMAAALAGGVPTADGITAAALKLGKALQDPAAGLSALSRVGLKFTIDQQAQIKSMEKSGNVIGAQQLMLAAVATKFGGSAAAAATPLQKLSTQFELLKERAGAQILPMFEHLASTLLGLVNPVVHVASAIKDFLGAHWQVLASIAGAIGLVIAGLKLWEFWTNMVKKAWLLLDAVAFGTPWMLIIGGIIAIVIYLMTKFGAVRNVVADVVQFCMRILGDMAQFIVNAVVGSVETLLHVLGSIPIIGGPFKQASAYVDSFRITVDNAISAVQNLNAAAGISNIGNFLHDAFTGGGSGGYSGGGGVAGGIAPSIAGASPKAVKAVQNLATNVQKALLDFRSKIVQSVTGLGSVIANNLAGPSGSFTIGASLNAQLAKAKAFVADITALRARGLNTTSLNELIAAGPDKGFDAAQALMSATKAEIAGVNTTETQLNALGNKFATAQMQAEFGNKKAVAANKVQLSIDLTGVSNDALVQALRKAIRTKGGNVQTVLGGG